MYLCPVFSSGEALNRAPAGSFVRDFSFGQVLESSAAVIPSFGVSSRDTVVWRKRTKTDGSKQLHFRAGPPRLPSHHPSASSRRRGICRAQKFRVLRKFRRVGSSPREARRLVKFIPGAAPAAWQDCVELTQPLHEPLRVHQRHTMAATMFLSPPSSSSPSSSASSSFIAPWVVPGGSPSRCCYLMFLRPHKKPNLLQ